MEEEEETLLPKAEDDDPNKQWYVIHTYSGYENKVRDNLVRRIESMGMKEKIFQVLVPTEEEIEFKDGKKKTVQKKIYPGYVLVQMIMTEDSWYVVRNTSGVTGFVGPGVKPIPLPKEEVKEILRRMGMEAPVKVKIDLEVGQGVRVIRGPFKDFSGIVEEVNEEKEKLRVLISIFGRETPVELDFGHVEKL
ncbi:MAG: transcription termination/antitermination protein NusG [Chloroflexi bacterium]|nr:transcription termination/antitermination protein NusG [Chloroflexota bacterium]